MLRRLAGVVDTLDTEKEVARGKIAITTLKTLIFLLFCLGMTVIGIFYENSDKIKDFSQLCKELSMRLSKTTCDLGGSIARGGSSDRTLIFSGKLPKQTVRSNGTWTELLKQTCDVV